MKENLIYLTDKVNREKQYSIFRLYLKKKDMEYFDYNNTFLIDENKYKLNALNYIQIDELGNFDCFAIFKKL